MASIPEKQSSSAPISNSEQSRENLSVDEMLARLKKNDRLKQQSRQTPQGELITREDGTQVIKVRKRKRRTHQPAKKSNSASKTNPKLKWIVLGSLVSLLILSIIATIFIIAKYNGRKFKTQTEATISELLGAKQTTISQLRVTPVSTKASKIDLVWDDLSFIKDASFVNISGDIQLTSFFSKEWIGREIVASSGIIHLQAPNHNPENSISENISPYRFGSIRCNQINLFFGSERNSPMISDLEASLRQTNQGNYNIVFRKGLINLKNWPKLKLSSGIISLNSQSIDLEALLKAEATHNGELTLKGNISKSIDSPAILDVKAKNYPIQEILGKALGRLIHGKLQSDNGSLSYHYKKPSSESLSFILPFNSTEIQFEGLPMFKRLNQLMGNTAYNRPVFQICHGTIVRKAQELSINDIEFINNGLMNLSGNIHVNANGKLSGTLRVSIPQAAFADTIPSAFTGPSEGFYHIDVTLNGSVQTPNDNLHTLLQTKKKTLIQPSKPQQTSPHTLKLPDQQLPPPNEQDFDKLNDL